jgi:hypothetical protein
MLMTSKRLRSALSHFVLLSATASAQAEPAITEALIQDESIATADAKTVLERDRNARRAAAIVDLGKGASAKDATSAFVVASPERSVVGPSVSFVKSVTAAYENGRFGKSPERAVSIYIFPDTPRYEAFCKQKTGEACISPYGFYLSSTRTIAMHGGADGTLSHELVHPFVEADFPKAPTWLNEGIASLFEGPYLPKPGEIHGANNWRLPRLQKALQSKEEKDGVTLDALFAMSDETFRGNHEDLHYAMARFFAQWLDGKGKLWDFYHAYRDHVETDPRGEKAFQDTVGSTPAEASSEWIKWVKPLRK